MNATELWKRYQRHLCHVGSVGLTLDVSRMRFDEGFFEKMSPAIGRAYEAMDALEAIYRAEEKWTDVIDVKMRRADALTERPGRSRTSRLVEDSARRAPSCPAQERTLRDREVELGDAATLELYGEIEGRDSP